MAMRPIGSYFGLTVDLATEVPVPKTKGRKRKSNDKTETLEANAAAVGNEPDEGAAYEAE